MMRTPTPLILLLCCLLSACGGTAETANPHPSAMPEQASPPKALTDVSGQVLDQLGNPLPGVIVTPIPTGSHPVALPRIVRYTDANGKFTWPVPPGTYDFTFQCNGYLGQRISVDTTKTKAPITVRLMPAK
ncbi:Carboxypeptidase regulatory-like domain-containing protein [Laceyella tengchongensis]|uniref:Carboxypeptidase regulatory-like domain-containing protein n=1 Tax=Laceyella tengchongensis TaxID=574699 RepID=A0AA46ACV1_9BACL|nr:carboxypeptidase-like regulatory domain-containing protein [Laceyella tengchongensis]SMP01033.1 Carboxypeptidase regulatory-like domain-containing protein [Laceyella tengchongensis]